ncbi:hypothetical protein EMMF5_000408 [Cystobasidiomycetes sp. EMM_F5]
MSVRQLLLAAAWFTTAAVAQGPGNLNYLKSCLGNAGIQYLTSSSGSTWSSAIKPFNQRISYTPIAVVQPTSAQQVASAVKCGVDAAYWINARGGGHSYASNALGGENYHILIDLKQLNKVTVSGENQPVNVTSSMLAAYQQFSETAPREWGSTLNMFAGSRRGTISSSFTITYIGSQSTFEDSVVAPLLTNFPATSTSRVTSQSWKDTLQLLAGNQNLDTSKQSDYQDTFYAKSIMTPESAPMTSTALTSFSNYLATNGFDAVNNGQARWFVQVELYGGQNSQINAVPASATAFVHRSSLFTIQFYASSYNCRSFIEER